MNINMNLVCEYHKLSWSVAGLSGSIESPELVVREQPQFHEQGSGTFVIVHEHF